MKKRDMAGKIYRWSLAFLLLALTAVWYRPVQAEAAPYLTKTELVMVEGGVYHLKVKKTSKSVTWKSQDTAVATVNDTGRVVAVSKGSTEITAKTGKTILVCSVKVDQGELNLSQMVLATGNSTLLTYSGDEPVSWWRSSNKKVLTVSSKGRVRAKGTGSAKITARIGESELTCQFCVWDPVKKDDASKIKTGSWTEKFGKTYYTFKDSSMLVGSRLIGSSYYVFDDNGALQTPEKKSIVDIGKRRYYVMPSGKAVSGWHVIDKKLYYAEETGLLKKNTTFEGIELGSDGAAKDTKAATWQYVVSEKVDSLVTDSMTKSQKLRACWNYITSKKNFRYRLRYPNLNVSGWQKETAHNMLTTRSGNCYSFACAFAAMAHDVGYNSYVICGRVSGSRDHASDGLTRHAWVMIGGLHYDPEGQFAGWYRGCYGSKGYRIRHTIQRKVKYA